METDGETFTSTHLFRGNEYIVTMEIQQDNSAVLVEVEDRVTADQWRATFDASYIEDLTHKTGNFKQFTIFLNMLESAISQTSDSVSLDLLTYSDLESLRHRKTGSTIKSSIPAPRATTLNSKRYLILTYTVEFDRIHYPLPLPYVGKPDPRMLQETIRKLRSEIKKLKQQGGSDYKVREHDKLQKEYTKLIHEKEDLETEFLQFRRELKNTSTGNAVAEMKILKGIVKNLEEELMKEKTRHQRLASKRGQEYRELLEEVEELRASERNLRVRVKSLTNEIAIYKRDRTRPVGHRSRNPAIERSASYERFPSRERSLSRERSYSTRDRSLSQERLYGRNRSTSRERSLSRERPSSAVNKSNNSQRSSYVAPRSLSPSPAGCRNPRFNPTAYIKEKARRTKEANLKKKREARANVSGVSLRSRQSPRHSSSYLSGSSYNRTRTSSLGSQGELSDGWVSDSSNGRLRNYNSNNSSGRKSSSSYIRSPGLPPKHSRKCVQKKKVLASTPDSNRGMTRSIRNKENYKESENDDDDYFDRSAEISEIDERLNRLQQLLKSSMP